MQYVCCRRWATALIALCVIVASPMRVQASEPPAPDQLFTQNRFKEARAAYTAILKYDFKQIAPRLGLIRTLFRLDSWREALTTATETVELAPKDADAHGLLSLALMRAGMPEKAAAEAKTALQLNGESYWALVAVGRMLLWDFKRPEAQEILHHAARLHPDWPEAWYNLVDASGDEVTEENLKDIVTYLHLAPKGHPNDLATEALPTRLAFIRDFLNDQPYHEVSPLTALQMRAVDKGDESNVEFTTTIERSGDYVILPIKVNDQKLRVLFDTGGGFEITLDKKTSEKLGLPVLYKSIVRGVSGKEPSKLYKAKSLGIGDQVFGGIPVEGIENELGDFDGVFGVTNLDHYAVIIDFEHNKLTLKRGKTAGAPPAPEGRHLLTLPFHYVDGDIFVPVTVEGRSVWAIVDTGADAYALLSLRTARLIAAGRNKSTFKEGVLPGRFGIGTSDTKQTVLAFLDPIALTVENTSGSPFNGKIVPAAGASPLDDQISPASDFEVGALLGIGFLTTAKRVTFDYPHRLMTLEFTDKSK